jgi:hypothetical protein
MSGESDETTTNLLKAHGQVAGYLAVLAKQEQDPSAHILLAELQSHLPLYVARLVEGRKGQ